MVHEIGSAGQARDRVADQCDKSTRMQSSANRVPPVKDDRTELRMLASVWPAATNTWVKTSERTRTRVATSPMRCGAV
jgi:hypothetical protein